MRSLFSSIQFLTAIRVFPDCGDRKYLSRSLAYFPITGLLIGLSLALFFEIFSLIGLDKLLICCLVVTLQSIITRSMHLDGLADTSDAFLSGKGREEMLRIMRDPHIGTMGTVSLIVTILLKITLLYSIPHTLLARSIVLMCVLSRWAMAISVLTFPYARIDGKAKAFYEKRGSGILVIATASSILISFVLFRIAGIAILAGTAACAYAMGRISQKKIGGITGDVIGAINEICEIASLFFIIASKALFLY